jgi:hypothetical protein
MEETILQNKDTIKKNVKSKFKEKMWCDKELEEKRKLRYSKDLMKIIYLFRQVLRKE